MPPDDEQNPFLVGLPKEGDVPEVAGAPQRQEPLTVPERLIIQNFFDTQPKLRKAYIEKKGFQLNPANDNEYRPMGSQGEWAEIDPGVQASFRKGGLKELAKEMLLDAGDIGWDATLQSLAVGGGAAAGSSIPALGTIVGGVLGGVAGNAASEAFKVGTAEMLLGLDNMVKPELELAAIQSLVAGSVPLLGKGLQKAGNTVISAGIRKRAQAIVNAAKSSGSGVTEELMMKAAANPDDYSKEAVAGANKKLEALYKGIFGVEPDSALTPKSTRQINPESLFGRKLKPLNEAATKELDRLSLAPEADWAVDELTAPMKAQIDRLASKFDRTSEEAAALKYLRDKVSYVENKATGFEPKVQKWGEEQRKKYLAGIVGLGNNERSISTPNMKVLTKDVGDGYDLVKHGNADFYIAKPDPASKDTWKIGGKLSFSGEGIDHFALRPELQNKGIADKLLDAAETSGMNIRNASEFFTEEGAAAVKKRLLKNAKLNFKEGREVLKVIQDDAFNRELPGASIIKQAVGGNANGLRTIADMKAAKAYESLANRGVEIPAPEFQLPGINAKRSDILGVFQQAKTNLTPTKITSAYVGNENISKLQSQETLRAMSQVLGEDLEGQVEKLSQQRFFDNLYKGSASGGSARANASIVQGATEGMAKGGSVGAVIDAVTGQPGTFTKAGTVIGGARGAQQAAAFSKPEEAVANLGKLLNKQQAIDASSAAPLGYTGRTLSLEAGNTATDLLAEPEPGEEENPFLKGL